MGKYGEPQRSNDVAPARSEVFKDRMFTALQGARPATYCRLEAGATGCAQSKKVTNEAVNVLKTKDRHFRRAAKAVNRLKTEQLFDVIRQVSESKGVI